MDYADRVEKQCTQRFPSIYYYYIHLKALADSLSTHTWMAKPFRNFTSRNKHVTTPISLKHTKLQIMMFSTSQVKPKIVRDGN